MAAGGHSRWRGGVCADTATVSAGMLQEAQNVEWWLRFHVLARRPRAACEQACTRSVRNQIGKAEALAPTTISRRSSDSLALSLMLFMSTNSVLMSLMPIVTSELEDKFSFSASQVGFLTSIFMLMFALGAIPMGLAALRWGGLVLVVGAACVVAGSVLFAFSSSYPWFLVARFLQGVGGSTVIPVCNPLIAQKIAPGLHARALGMFGAGHGLGVVAALLILPSVQKARGYRAVFLVAAAMVIVVALVALAQKAVRSRPQRSLVSAVSLGALVREVGSVAVNRKLILLAIMNIGVMAIVVGLLAWTPLFLHEQRGASLAVAAYLTAGIGVAQIVGNVAGAVAMARWGKVLVLLVSSVVMMTATALVPVAPGFALVFVCVTIAGFLTMALFPAIFGSVPDVVRRPEQVGPATGFINLTGLVGTLLAPWMFGVLLDAYGTDTNEFGYLWGYLLLALFPLLGTLASIVYAINRGRSKRGVVQLDSAPTDAEPNG